MIASPTQRYVFTLETDPGVPVGEIGFNIVQRKWAMLSLNQEVDVRPFEVQKSNMFVANITVQTKFFSPKKLAVP